MSLADAFRREESKRDAVRRAVVTDFDISGDMRYCVRRADIHASVRRHLELPLLSSSLAREINMVCAHLGGVLIANGNRRLIRGARRKGMPDAIALQQAREMTTRHGRPVIKQTRAEYLKVVGSGNSGNSGNPVETVDYEKLLAGEGMSAEPHSARMVDPLKAEITGARLDKAHLVAEVMRLSAEGKSIRDIAGALGVDRNKVHRWLTGVGLCKTPAQL